jgi:hypothetical protein
MKVGRQAEPPPRQTRGARRSRDPLPGPRREHSRRPARPTRSLVSRDRATAFTRALRLCWCLSALIAGVLAMSGCAASNSSARPAATATPKPASLPRCRSDTTRAKLALPRIRADIARIRHAKTHAQTSAATDRFINDFEHSALSLVTKSRLIDLAVSAVDGKCDDCFQALEPMHPKPQLAMHACR